MRYRCTVVHHRVEGGRYSFRYRLRMWLTDLDAPDRRGRLARLLREVRPADHLGDPAGRLRDNVDRFLRHHGIDLAGGRVLMLSQAAGLGYVFDPVTVYWCHDPGGRIVCVVLEVRNTFGDRHCYLVRPDADGPDGRTGSRFGKELYVSPFFPRDGHYAALAHLGETTVRLRLSLYRGGDRPALVATLTGVREPPGAWRDALATLTNPAAARWTTVRVHYQALRLRRRGLPRYRRRTHPPQSGVHPPRPPSPDHAPQHRHRHRHGGGAR
ncbi:DUF1365 domain-containing protein [Streptomyces sp. NPDC093252]|uniref:DUF1365 domain-containing protein n=1 Tax=Streptomyces sp. NPDC093252 TaxID=3154980 RepID=UPI0034162FDB